jgi:serine/threonine protein kinase
MSTQHQQQSPRDIFLACVKCAMPRERDEIIARECRGDDALQSAVVSLLEAHEANGSFLENPIEGLLGGRGVGEPAPTVAFHAAEQPGSKIGPYKLLQQIGEGGFGVVYMAEQTQPVRRRVALKVIKAGMDTKEVIVRFEAERQALALMDHPNIAKVLDAGTTSSKPEAQARGAESKPEAQAKGDPDTPSRALRASIVSGRPYFVMELVHGVPITEFCDENRLTTRERLELFVHVCRAVQHAHQKGIIHRDLKPSNVMVTMNDDKPMPKVIDFGISKALSQQLTEKTLFTAYGQMVGTPLYMSPEQAQFNVQDVDTRSDVYSLGVLLYELLTGSTPFDRETLQKSGFDEMRRMIREVDPPRPSARISTLKAEALSTVSDRRQIDPRKFSQSLRGELDWIVMKALEKDRNRRYESASAFAADVERHLADEAVQACPPSVGYRIKKLVRRHRVAIATSATVSVAITAALAFATWKAVLARRAYQSEQSAHQRAEAHLRLSLEAVDRLLEQVAEEKLLNEPHLDDLRRRLLADALVFCQALAQEEGGDATVQMRTARAARRVASINNHLGAHEQALREAQRAVALLTKLPAGMNAEQRDIELAEAYRQVGGSQTRLLRFEEAEAGFKAAVSASRESLLQWPNNIELKRQLALSLGSLANLLGNNHKQDYESALVIHAEAINVLNDLQRQLPKDAEIQSFLAGEHHNVAMVLLEQGKLVEAEKRLRIAIELQEVIAKSEGKPRYRTFLGNHYRYLGRVLRERRQLDAAADALRRCIAVRERLWKDHPVVPSYQEAAANAHGELSWVLSSASKHSEAVASARKAIAILEDLATRFPRYQVHLAGAYSNLSAREYARGGNSEAARGALQKAATIYQQLYKEAPDIAAYRYNLAGTNSNLAIGFKSDGDFKVAESLCREGLRLMRGLIDDFPDGRVYYLRFCNIGTNLADILHETDRDQESVAVLREVFNVARQMHKRWSEVPSYERHYADAAASLAWRLLDVNNRKEAAELFQLALPILKSHAAHSTAAIPRYVHARAQWGMGKLMAAKNAPAEAVNWIDGAADNYRKLVRDYPKITALRANLAAVCLTKADVLHADKSVSDAQRRRLAKKTVDEGVALFGELLKEKGGNWLLREIDDYVQSPACLEHESFRQLLNAARAKAKKAGKDK